jgi:hypothetical protein
VRAEARTYLEATATAKARATAKTMAPETEPFIFGCVECGVAEGARVEGKEKQILRRAQNDKGEGMGYGGESVLGVRICAPVRLRSGQALRGRRVATLSHLSHDKTVAKMGHPD